MLQPDAARPVALGDGRENSESIGAIMAGLVPAIHVVQAYKAIRLATISQLHFIEL